MHRSASHAPRPCVRARFRRAGPGLAAIALTLGMSGCTAEPPAAWLAESVREPRVFAPGVISTGLREYGITFSPDGRDAWFTRRGRRGPSVLLWTRFENGAWTEPELPDFAGDRDQSAYVTPDGETMVFASRRTIRGSGDRSDNLWIMERTQEGWSEPRPLPGIVNRPRSEVDDYTVGYELGPVLLPDEDVLLYTTRAAPDWGSDIYVADRDPDGAFVNPRPLRLNTPGDETNPAITPDGRFLVFQGYRDADGLGDQDLYVSRRNAYGWDTPVALPEPFNSPRNDGWPAFTPDGRFFFFATDRETRGGYYDIWYVETDALGLEELTGR